METSHIDTAPAGAVNLSVAEVELQAPILLACMAAAEEITICS